MEYGKLWMERAANSNRIALTFSWAIYSVTDTVLHQREPS
jgi:hypothetical protein